MPFSDHMIWTARRLPVAALVPIAGITWWLVGYLPWIADGLSRPTSRGGPVGGSSAGLEAPHLALPLIAMELSLLVLGAGFGGLFAGLSARVAAGRLRVRATAAAAGVAMAVAVTLIQSRRAIEDAAGSSFAADSRVLDGLCLLVVVTALTGLAVGLLGITGTAGLGVATGAVAGLAPAWLISLLTGMGEADPELFGILTEISRWTGAILLTFALVVIGHRPASRILAWPIVVLIAWLAGPSLTAMAYLEQLLRPSSGLPASLPEHVAATVQVWTHASSPAARPLTPWVFALAAAVAITALRARRLKRASVKQTAS